MPARFLEPDSSRPFIPDNEPRFTLSIPFTTASGSADPFPLPCLAAIPPKENVATFEPQQTQSEPSSPNLSYTDPLQVSHKNIKSRSPSMDIAFVEPPRTPVKNKKEKSKAESSTSDHLKLPSETQHTDSLYDRPRQKRIYRQKSFTWYENHGQKLLLKPPAPPSNEEIIIHDGDIMVYTHSNNSAAQSWVWNNHHWHVIEEGDNRNIGGRNYVFRFGKFFSPTWTSLLTIERAERRRRNI